MLAEDAEVTDVMDAVDPGSTWSLRATVGYQRTMRNSVLERERSTISAGVNPSPSSSGTTEFDPIARYEQVVQTLNLGLELPIYHDLAVFFGVPLILSDDRKFTAHGDTTPGQVTQRLLDGFDYTMAGGSTGTSSLFSVPFTSPTRSGVDYIRVGLLWAILDQSRDIHLPTWLVRIEWRPAVGAPLRPCSVEAGATVCPVDPSVQWGGAGNYPRALGMNSADYNSYTALTNTALLDAMHPYQRQSQAGADPGISRRVNGLYFQTIMSRRIGYIEPYIGLDALFEVPDGNMPSFRFNEAAFGQMSTYPPIHGSFLGGVEIIPWENREAWQRLLLNLWVRGDYYSQGRDYSALYDALGTSNSIPLNAAQFEINRASQGDYSSPLFFTGTTGIHSHGSLTGGMRVSLQPAKMLRFNVGASLGYTAPFLQTATDACNPNQSPSMQAYIGGCNGNSVPDPYHRPVIDAAGQRFRTTDDWTWNIYVNLVLQPRFY